MDYRNADGTVNLQKLQACIVSLETSDLPDEDKARWRLKFGTLLASRDQPRAEARTTSAKSSGGVTIDVFGAIGEDWFSEGLTAKTVAAAVRETAGTITLRINSGGGDAFEGDAIYNILTSAPNRVEVEVLALAASAASVVAMAGDEIRMAENAVMMIHNAKASAFGGVEKMESAAQLLRAINSLSAQLYARKSGQPVESMAELMRKETYLTAQEAVNMGLASRVVPGLRAQAAAPFDMSAAPAHIQALLLDTHRATVASMNLQELAKRLGLPADATEAQCMAALDTRLAEPAPKAAAVTPPAAAVEVVQSSGPEVLAELHATAAAVLVDRHISEGRIAPAMRDKAIVACGTTAAQLSACATYWEGCPNILPAAVRQQVANGGVVKTAAPSAVLTPETMTRTQLRMCKEAGITHAEFCARKNESAAKRARGERA